MKKSTLLVVLAVFGCAALGWWWLESNTRPPASTQSGPGPLREVEPLQASTPPPPIQDGPSGAANSADAHASNRNPAGGDLIPGSDSAAEPALRPAGVPTVGEILETETEDYVGLANRLGTLVRDARLPMEERAEALAHAMNLSAGNEAAVLTPMVKDPAVPDELAEAILDEALNRPLAYQADLYLEALKDRTSAGMQTKIREHLAFLTGGEDLGPDPQKWTSSLAAAKNQWAE